MIKPLVLGNRTFPVNLIQGPLAGISCAPFRELTWRYSQPAFSCTEMISCKTLLYSSLQTQQRFIQKAAKEGPVSFQLASNSPEELATAVKKVTDLGADLIDLNCGCPVKKIRKQGAGSSLLTKTSILYQLIRAMKNNTHVPVSIKIRVEGGGEKFNQEIVNMIKDAGADFLVVHGRHWTEHYETACRYDSIQFFAENLDIPVIGNGDITDITSLKKMFATGVDGVMIARAGVGQPWLIKRLIAEMQQQVFTPPDVLEIGAAFFEHAFNLAKLLQNEKFAVLQARKFGKYYVRELSNRNQLVEKLNICNNLIDLEKITLEYFKCLK